MKSHFKMSVIRAPSGTPGPTADKACTHTQHIDELLQGNPNLWRGCDMAGQGCHGRSTGFPQLDDILPGRGWPDRGLVEIISPCWGMGELQLLIPLMRSTVEQGKWILWISPPYLLYAPALVQAGGTGPATTTAIPEQTGRPDAGGQLHRQFSSPGAGL